MAIHPTAIVDKLAEVAASAEIGPLVVIEGPVMIGEEVKVYPNAYISGWTEIGDRCEIHPNAVVGHLPQDFHFEGGRSFCKIGAGTIIRECASIHRGTQAESWTTIGENCFILGYAHIGHNCHLGNGVKLYNCSALSGHVEVGDHAIVSGYSLVHQFCRIGEHVMIGGGARVTKDVPPFMKSIYESTCVGYNAVGMKRSELFTDDEISEVRLAYKMLFRTDVPFSKAVEQFAGQVQTKTGRRLVEFLRAESKLGIISGRKNAGSARDFPGTDEEA